MRLNVTDTTELRRAVKAQTRSDYLRHVNSLERDMQADPGPFWAYLQGRW